MKNDSKTLTGRFGAMVLLVAAGLFMVLTAAGCGMETEQASALVGEVNAIWRETEPKFAEVEKLISDASVQLSAGQVEAERASLTRAQVLLDEIIPEITRAKEKTDEAAALNISEAYRQHLEARSKAGEYALALTQSSREWTSVWLADLTLENPATLTKINELRVQIETLSVQLNEAEAEANRIAEENRDEIAE